MSLKARLDRAGIRAEDLDPDSQASDDPARNAAVPGRTRRTPDGPTAPARPLTELKMRAQSTLFVRLGARLYDSSVSDDAMRALVNEELREILDEEQIPLTHEQHDALVREIASNALGYGPLEQFLEDDRVSEIMVLGDKQIFVEQDGKLRQTNTSFVSEDHLRRTIERIVSEVGRRIDESSPMVDARLPDGSRVNAIIPPLAVDGSILTVRKFARTPFSVAELVGFGMLTEELANFLEVAVKARITILISGGTSTGKTTFLNVLSGYVPEEERIVSIEDSIELQLRQQHVARLESRPPNIEGKGEVTIRDLVRNALRMRPDRIVVGEVRGGESFDMLQAMNTGHEGSLTTMHANTPRDAVSRLETMVLMAGMDLPHRAIRDQIVSAVDLVVQLSRLSDGTRRVTKVTEITGMEGDVVQLADIFAFDWEAGVDTQGRFQGTVQPTGLRPTFEKRIHQLGLHLDASTFETASAPGARSRRRK